MRATDRETLWQWLFSQTPWGWSVVTTLLFAFVCGLAVGSWF